MKEKTKENEENKKTKNATRKTRGRGRTDGTKQYINQLVREHAQRDLLTMALFMQTQRADRPPILT